MKKCMYCLEEKVGLTREHIIPAGLLVLYPEQDVTFNSTTINNQRYKDNKGHTIKDVCDTCNNVHLESLDNYGNNLIRKYFFSKYEENSTVSVLYDYHMLQRWLLKITYNTVRSAGLKSDWFNDELGYIFHNIQDHLPPVSIFGGLHIDMTAYGEDKAMLLSPISSYKPLYIYRSPNILENGIVFSIKRKISMSKDAMKIRRSEHVFCLCTWLSTLKRRGRKACIQHASIQFVRKKTTIKSIAKFI
jgi:hypothetical protein